MHLAPKLGPRQAQCGQHGFARTIEAEEKLEIAVKLQNCKFSACRIESSNLVQVGPNLGPAAPRNFALSWTDLEPKLAPTSKVAQLGALWRQLHTKVGCKVG